MNEKITLPSLINLLSANTGDSKKLSEDFVKAFFTTISNALAVGESVKVKNFGVFKCIDVDARKSVNVNTGAESMIPAHKKVVFIPTKDLAALVNAPFEMFDSVEIVEPSKEEEQPDLPEPVEEEQPDVAELAEEEAIVAADAEDELSALTTVEAIAEAEDPEISDNSDISDKSDVSDMPDMSDMSDEEDAPIYNLRELDMPDEQEGSLKPEEESSEQEKEPEPEEEPVRSEEVHLLSVGDQRKRHRFLFGFLTGVAASVVATIIAWVIFIYVVDKDIKPVPSPEPVAVAVKPAAVKTDNGSVKEVDSVPAKVAKEEAAEKEQVAPTAESDKRVYDTITKTRYLTTMAQDHYGNFNLWPYIYMENKDFLGHPDRIRPGTKVVIPDLAKYGVNPKNKNDIAKAKKLGVEIYSRYQ